MAKATPKKRKRRSTKKNNALYMTIAAVVGIFMLIVAMFQLGTVGMLLANGMRYLVGNFYQVFLVILIAVLIYFVIYQKKIKLQKRYWIGGILIMLPILTLATLLFAHQLNSSDHTKLWHQLNTLIAQDIGNGSTTTNVGGGMIGVLSYSATHYLISDIGTWFLSIVAIIFGLAMVFNLPLRTYFSQLITWVKQQTVALRTRLAKRSHQAKQDPKINSTSLTPLAAEIEKTTSIKTPEIKWQKPEEAPAAHQTQADAGALFDEMPSSFHADESTVTEPPVAAVHEATSDEPIDPQQLGGELETAENPDYHLPSYELLEKVEPVDQTEEFNQLTKKSQIVHDTLKSFNIDAEVTSVSLGPTVTQYELKPAVGVKVSKIANLSDDLAMALSAKSIRIEAPIPGKPYVGIEVPNETAATVSFRDVTEHAPAHQGKLLTVPLGRNVTGDVELADLTEMPHLLIAGSTGSGKSVAINGIIASLLMQAKPHELKLLMIDPKKVELSVYNGIPHLLSPVVSEPRKAAKALQKVVTEMERRYQQFAKLGVRNIKGYNAYVDQHNQEQKEETLLRMPYIVSIVDELADLMMTVSGDVEPAIIRIAQMGRAAGIHLILATQRPSVDVITGLIKANVPSRIAFAVSSGIDSRTILDQNGAEKLLGKGDMIFAPIGKEPRRVQGAFISDRDVERIVEDITAQQQAQYVESMTVTDEDLEGHNGGSASDDELYEEAKSLVIDQQKASTSLLQRRFRIGYNRAARLIDDLEAAGVIGPQDGSRPREVLQGPQG